MISLRLGVLLASILGCVLYAAVSVALGQGAPRDDVQRELVLACVFVTIMSGLSPIITHSLGPARVRTQRLTAALCWTLVFPLITMFPLGLIIPHPSRLEYVVHFATYCAWTSAAIGAVVFAGVYAHRTRYVMSPSKWRTRVLMGLGVSMTAVTAVFMVPFTILALGIVVAGVAASDTPAPQYLFPETFAGTATLIYPDSAAPPGTRVNNGWVFEFPATGELRISDRSLGAQRSGKFFFVDDSGRRRPVPRGTEAECLPIFKDPSLAQRAQRDAVCARSSGYSTDTRRIRVEFIVLRAPKSALR